MSDATKCDESPAEQVRRMKACLAEAGYPSTVVRWGTLSDGTEGLQYDADTVPRDVAWRALVVLDPLNENPLGCWPCFKRTGGTTGCSHDYRTQPFPSRRSLSGLQENP